MGSQHFASGNHFRRRHSILIMFVVVVVVVVMMVEDLEEVEGEGSCGFIIERLIRPQSRPRHLEY